jgi:RNA polymerase sigma-70 factor (sigma-E family)
MGKAAASRLEQLYEAHVGRAVSLARLLTGDDQTAEDVAHDSFIRATGRFADLRRPESFDAYLRKTVVNECRARWRRRRLERDWLRRQPPAEQVARPSFDPDERSVIWHAITALPWRQRAAVVLRFYEDLPQREVAELLRCSTGAVESLLSRAIVTLRSAMDEEDHR